MFITGGAQRIGRAIALAAAAEGADVAVTYLSSVRPARQLVRELETASVRALAVRCDVRRERDITHAVSAVVRHLGRIDVLVNNAAVFESVPFDELTAAQWDRVFETNARGPFLVTRACLQHLRKRRGRIVNIGSLGGLQPWSQNAHYCASKAALLMLSRVMARALAPAIAVNCVAPGMIETDRTRAYARTQVRRASAGQPAWLTRLAARTPMQRNGTPQDVAAAVMFFATAPQFITGQLLVVDGGLSLV